MFVVEDYFRNGKYQGSRWYYSIEACKQEFGTQFQQHYELLIRHVSSRLRDIGSVNKEKDIKQLMR